MRLLIEALHDRGTGSVSYLVVDRTARKGAVIDCWLGLDLSSGRIDRACVAHWTRRVERLGIDLAWILETHVHADHLSGAVELRAAAGGRIGIGAGILDVAARWQSILALPPDANTGANFDRLFANGDELRIGDLPMGVMATPGHTPSCVTYLVGDAAFVGDTLFMPQAGTARCDFPGGSARTLYRSIRRILALPPGTRIFCAHDYGPTCGRPASWESNVVQQRRNNVQAHLGVSEDEFVAFREARDRELAAPALIYPALQVNLRAGRLPEREANGIAYLRLPLEVQSSASSSKPMPAPMPIGMP